MIYDDWKNTYEESVEELSIETWQKGIIKELSQIGANTGVVLDAGAGTGIGARLIRKLGEFRIISVDRCEAMLIESEQYSDETYVRNLSDIGDIAHRIDYIVSGFDTINYLSRYELGEFFLWASNHLNESGKIIFDYSSPKLLRDDWNNLKYDQEISSGKLYWSHQYIDALEISQTIIKQVDNKNKEMWSENHIQYAFDPFGIQRIANHCGLKVEKVRNLNNDDFSPAENTHVYVIGK